MPLDKPRFPDRFPIAIWQDIRQAIAKPGEWLPFESVIEIGTGKHKLRYAAKFRRSIELHPRLAERLAPGLSRLKLSFRLGKEDELWLIYVKATPRADDFDAREAIPRALGK